MQEFSLKIEVPINGIYLNSETIELLSIIQCNSIEELKKFALGCSQLNISNQDVTTWNESNLEDKKRELVGQYKSTLIPMEQSIKDRKSVIKSKLEHIGIRRNEVDSYITAFKNGGYEAVKQKLEAEYPEKYDTLIKKEHRFISTERDQMRDVSYEELVDINNNLSNYNTILVASGRYYDVTKKMYNEKIPNMEKYDFYYPQRGLDFCYKNGMRARYHTLLDKQTMENHLLDKSKDEVLKELKDYVKNSIDFISEYNKEHKIDGKGEIVSVDLFNEIISFDEPYRNMWQELYGISNKELVEVFKYAKENKPDGVTYVYNEPFLENSKRRQVVINQLKEINELSPGLIDTIGTQMHIEMIQDPDEIKKCFLDLKSLEELGIRTQITEFDMCLPERIMFDDNGMISEKYSPEFIYNFKAQKMQEISNAINETGIELEGITYWSISDTLDHNLERTNRKTYEQGLQREIAKTRYAGLYSELGKNKIVQTSQLYQETLEEQKDIEFLNKIENEERKQKIESKEIEENNDYNK